MVAMRSPYLGDVAPHFVDEGNVRLGGIESFAHGVDGRVATAPLAARLERARHVSGRSIRASHDHLATELRRGTAQLSEMALDARPAFGCPLEISDENESIAKARGTPIDRIGESAEPERNTPGGSWIQRRPIDAIEFALETDQRLAPQPAQQLHLLLAAAPARLEVLSKRLVLDVVPADAHAEPQAPAAQKIQIRSLPRDQDRLSLRQNQDSGDELDAARDRSQVREHDERIMEGVMLGIRPRELGLAVVRGAEDVIEGEKIIVARRLDLKADAPDRVGVTTQLRLRIDDADFHASPTVTRS